MRCSDPCGETVRGTNLGWIRGAFLSTMQPVVTFPRWSWGLVAVALGAAPSAWGWEVYRSESGAVLHWSEAAVAIAVSPPPSPLDRIGAYAALDFAVAQWRGLDCDGPLVTVDEREETSLDDEDEVSSVVWVNDPTVWSQRFGSAELARTIIIYRVQSGRIVEADIAVNLAGFDFGTEVECDAERYDLRMTFTHELGHFFGLDHSLVDGATMAAKADPGDCEGRSLSDDDKEGFCASYELPDVPEPEVGPEVVEVGPEIAEVVEVAEAAEAVDSGRRDEGCCGGGSVGSLALLSLLGLWRGVGRRGRRGRQHGRKVV